MPEERRLPIVEDRTIDGHDGDDPRRSRRCSTSITKCSSPSARCTPSDGKAIRPAITDLTLKGHVYEGRLPPPKGQTPDDWEDREQTLFRSTEFGDDVDRPLMKSDGSYTYFAADIAYHHDKLDRGFQDLINVLGADHGGYVKRMKALVTARVGRQGRSRRSSCASWSSSSAPASRCACRSGPANFVTLREVVDEVGRDPIRFMMLYRKNDAPLDFDFAKVTEQSKDNPVFYVQYASCALPFGVPAGARSSSASQTFDRAEMTAAAAC